MPAKLVESRPGGMHFRIPGQRFKKPVFRFVMVTEFQGDHPEIIHGDLIIRIETIDHPKRVVSRLFSVGSVVYHTKLE